MITKVFKNAVKKHPAFARCNKYLITVVAMKLIGNESLLLLPIAKTNSIAFELRSVNFRVCLNSSGCLIKQQIRVRLEFFFWGLYNLFLIPLKFLS